MYPTYPFTMIRVDHGKPAENMEIKRSKAGRIRVYDRGGFSDRLATVTHEAVGREEVDEVLDFYAANSGQLFWLRNALDETWIAQMIGRPIDSYAGGDFWNLEVPVVLYDPSEGGL